MHDFGMTMRTSKISLEVVATIFVGHVSFGMMMMMMMMMMMNPSLQNMVKLIKPTQRDEKIHCQAKTLDELYRNVAVWMTQNQVYGEFGDVFVWGEDIWLLDGCFLTWWYLQNTPSDDHF